MQGLTALSADGNYVAYISYASRDAAFARRLHRALETYDVRLRDVKVDTFGLIVRSRRLQPIFRNRRGLDLPLDNESKEALSKSGALIVVVSPNVFGSPRVEEEAAYFARLGRPILLIAPDEFGGSGGQAQQRLQADLGGRAQLVTISGPDGFRIAGLTLIARLIGSTPETLIDADRALLRRGAWKDGAWWTFSWALRTMIGALGALAAAFSVTSLVRTALTVDLKAFFNSVLQRYDAFVSVALCWAQPALNELAELVGRWIGWRLHVYDHWKHVFVLLLVYFFRDQGAGGWIRRPGGWAFFLCVGLPVAVLTSVFSGCIDVGGNNLATNSLAHFGLTNGADILVAATAVVGVGIYDFAKLLWYTFWLRKWHARQRGKPVLKIGEFFFAYLRYPVLVFAAGMLGAILGPQAPILRDVTSPGLAVIVLLVLALTIYWLWVGATRIDEVREPDDTWWRAFPRSGPGLLGLWMSVVFIGLALFFLMNAL